MRLEALFKYSGNVRRCFTLLCLIGLVLAGGSPAASGQSRNAIDIAKDECNFIAADDSHRFIYEKNCAETLSRFPVDRWVNSCGYWGLTEEQRKTPTLLSVLQSTVESSDPPAFHFLGMLASYWKFPATKGPITDRAYFSATTKAHFQPL